MDKNVEIKTAANAGFCFGVKRAIGLVEKTLNEKPEVYTLGPIIHNPQEVKRLKEKGVKILNDIDCVKSGCIILRTHGISLELLNRLEKDKTLYIIDATCPFVKKAQDIIKNLSSQETTIVIVGENSHPEVEALVSYGAGKCVVIENPREALEFKGIGDLNIVSQTTQTPQNFNVIVEILKKRFKVNIYNTICEATLERQESAKKLAKKVDLMIVIGGKNSGNTTRLAEICKAQTKTYHIETIDELDAKWFNNIKTVGLTAGASTPDNIIKSVQRRLGEILQTDIAKRGK
ncbi:4-hydroxy-3-methylbut-2-enyl diphosphate reductase [Candidatus Endomicrobiellum devescovinae]|uniref:4-hydroxy-3-methylbut-2-enyl diphosphate reductase n=1 Tax=Candidatus Endomicrobiellum devescovinae TaxID=3242322 RepID=UPI002832EF3D|nr:4-hydroxy-3-methylbut-2-enyl diphosphate reductase [Endomicrobium sp.]MDR1433796.1 4-hydroxy-3-methylbut-2-enyl diphosphate reductase [Endomicrobium sp.]